MLETAEFLFKKNNYDSAIYVSRQAISYSLQHNYLLGQAWSIIKLNDLLIVNEELTESEKNIPVLFHLGEQLKDSQAVAISFLQKAQVQLYPEVKIVMHTVFDDNTRIFDSICYGADGYLLKNTPPLQLIQSLEEVMKGGVPMSPFVAQKIFQFFRKKPAVHDDFSLTNREKEVLELLVKGNSYKMIAHTCTISIDTVKRHLQNIYHKLHVNCGTEAVAKALHHKIVKLD